MDRRANNPETRTYSGIAPAGRLVSSTEALRLATCVGLAICVLRTSLRTSILSIIDATCTEGACAKNPPGRCLQPEHRRRTLPRGVPANHSCTADPHQLLKSDDGWRWYYAFLPSMTAPFPSQQARRPLIDLQPLRRTPLSRRRRSRFSIRDPRCFARPLWCRIFWRSSFMALWSSFTPRLP